MTAEMTGVVNQQNGGQQTPPEGQFSFIDPLFFQNVKSFHIRIPLLYGFA